MLAVSSRTLPRSYGDSAFTVLDREGVWQLLEAV
jgi:hypothetical protein